MKREKTTEGERDRRVSTSVVPSHQNGGGEINVSERTSRVGQTTEIYSVDVTT